MGRQVIIIARYTLMEAMRSRLAWLFIAAAAIGIGLSGFMQELAISEGRQTQLALLGAFLRFAAVFLVATFVATSMVREAADKGLEMLMALPLPRAGYVFGKLVGYGLLALAAALLFGMVSALFAEPHAALLWTASLACELFLVSAFTLLCALTFSQVTGALAAVMGFYLLSRSIAALQLVGQEAVGDSLGQQVMAMVIDSIALLLPHLDRFTRTDWLVYGAAQTSDLFPVVVQTLVYVALLCAASLFDIYRKNI